MQVDYFRSGMDVSDGHLIAPDTVYEYAKQHESFSRLEVYIYDEWTGIVQVSDFNTSRPCLAIKHS